MFGCLRSILRALRNPATAREFCRVRKSIAALAAVANIGSSGRERRNPAARRIEFSSQDVAPQQRLVDGRRGHIAGSELIEDGNRIGPDGACLNEGRRHRGDDRIPDRGRAPGQPGYVPRHFGEKVCENEPAVLLVIRIAVVLATME